MTAYWIVVGIVRRMWLMSERIKAYIMRVSDDGKPYKGYIGEIENTLKAKQTFVGGLIQVVPINEEIDLICNEEGKLSRLLPNRALYMENATDDEPYDFICGNCLCVRHNNEGEFTSIHEDDVKTIRKHVKPIEAILCPDIILSMPEDVCPEYKE
jgi:hypothetical protein